MGMHAQRSLESATLRQYDKKCIAVMGRTGLDHGYQIKAFTPQLSKLSLARIYRQSGHAIRLEDRLSNNGWLAN
jgi:hypothetical protein